MSKTAASFDQGAQGVGQLALHVALARWLELATYGQFAACYTIVVLANLIHNAVISEPTLVLGARSCAEPQRRFLSLMASFNIAFAVVAAVAVAAISAIVDVGLGLGADVPTWLSVGAAVAGTSFAWFARRTAYVLGTPWRATVVSSMHSAAVLVGVTALQWLSALNTQRAFIAIGAAGAISGLAGLRRAGIRPFMHSANDVLSTGRDVAAYARWGIAYAPVGWLLNNALYLLLPALSGLEAAGKFRAMMNVYLPFQHFITAAATASLPKQSSTYRTAGYEALIRTAKHQWKGVLVGVIAALLVLMLMNATILDLFFIDNLSFSTTSLLLGAALPLIWALSAAYTTALRAMAQPREVMKAHLLFGLVPAAVVFPVCAAHGVSAAMAGLSCSALLTTVGLRHGLRRLG